MYTRRPLRDRYVAVSWPPRLFHGSWLWEAKNDIKIPDLEISSYVTFFQHMKRNYHLHNLYVDIIVEEKHVIYEHIEQKSA